MAALGCCKTAAGETVLLAGVTGGIIRSDASGQEWTSHPFPLPAPLVVAFDNVRLENGRDVLLAATHQDGVFRRDCEGRTWRSANVGLYFHQITALCSIDGGHAVAATEYLAFETSNAGLSWSEIPGTDLNTGIAAVVGDGQRLVMGTDDGELLFYDRDQQQGLTRVLLNPGVEVLALALGGSPSCRELIAMTSDSLHRLPFTGAWGTTEVGIVSKRPISLAVTCAVFDERGDGIRAIIGCTNGSVVVEAVDVD